MKTIIKPRQTGKTTDLMKISAETKMPIIVKDKSIARLMIKRAKELKIEGMPEPIPLYEAMHTRCVNSPKVLVDDAEFILNKMMKETCGCEIDTLAMVQRNEKGHEITPDGEDLNEKYGLGD